MKGEEQAYVPYLFARDTVVKIVNDMHKMKDNHVNVINQIEVNYRMIEDETQVRGCSMTLSRICIVRSLGPASYSNENIQLVVNFAS